MAHIADGYRTPAVAMKFGCWCAACLCLWALFTSHVMAGETWVSAGVGGSADTLYSYGGVTLAPTGRLNGEGWRGRLWAKAMRLNEDAEHSSRSMVPEIHGIGAEAELGWQFVGPEWRFALYGGGVWRDEAEAGNRFGATLSAKGSYELSPSWQAIAEVKYTIGFDELWVQVRPEFKFDDGLYLGLVSSASKAKGYSILRGGASVGGFSYAVPWMGDIYVSVEAGIEFNIATKKEGPFGALHIGFAY